MLAYLRHCGETGSTDDEGERKTKLPHQTYSARRRALEQQGLVKRTSLFVKTRAGRRAAVYVAT